jgi:hypothetical protein
MRKSLALILNILLVAGSTQTVFAGAATANPFQKVPLGNWEYSNIQQLEKDGIFEDEDKQFKPNTVLTRYEIAVIVAKATANFDKANTDDKVLLDKLQTEYSPELTALGVHLVNEKPPAKNLADRISFSGEHYFQYQNQDTDSHGVKTKSNPFATRTRIYTTYKIDDQWSFTTRLQNTSTLNKSDQYETGTLGKNGTGTSLNEAYVTGNIFGGTTSIGRQGRHATVLDGLVYDGAFKGILTNYKLANNFQITGRYGTEISTPVNANNDTNTYGSLELTKNIGPAQLGLAYHNFSSPVAGTSKNVWQGYATFPISPDFSASLDYAKSNASQENKAYSLQISYKKTDVSQIGSYKLYTQYRRMEKNSTISTTYDIAGVGDGGFKGYEIGTEYVPWKNVVWRNEFIDGKSTVDNSSTTKYYYSRLWFFF